MNQERERERSFGRLLTELADKPAAVDRLLGLMEAEANHRRRMDKLRFERGLTLNWGGLIAGFLIGLAGLAAAIICALHDRQITASVIGGVNVLGLVSVFVLGRSPREGVVRPSPAQEPTGG